MSETVETPSLPVRRRDRSREARRATQAKKAERETRIVGLLNRGVSVAEIASRERVTLNRMRKVVRAILERRMPQPPAEYLALQVSRLNEALLVSYGAMYNPSTGADFKAIDSVVRIVREMDRYHGFAPAGERSQIRPRRLAASPERPLALEPPAADGLRLAPQALENPRFGVGNGSLVPSLAGREEGTTSTE